MLAGLADADDHGLVAALRVTRDDLRGCLVAQSPVHASIRKARALLVEYEQARLGKRAGKYDSAITQASQCVARHSSCIRFFDAARERAFAADRKSS